MKDCIFCKIARNEMPAYRVYEDDLVIAFLDIYPIHPGHVLVVPKQHSVDIFDTPSETLQRMVAVAKKLAPSVLKATKADAINLGMNNKEAAGQAVYHAHMHIIPRYKDDGLKNWGQNLFKDDEHKKQVHEALLQEIE